MERELLTLDIHQIDQATIMRLICDCAAITDIDITNAAGEFAITCNGCYTTRWFHLDWLK